MKRIFLDSDVILDALLKRPGFELPALNVISAAVQFRFKLLTSSIIFVNVHYFLDKFDRANKFELLRRLRSVISIIEAGAPGIDLALESGFNDFENAVQYYTAISAKADIIITRNIKDYKNATIPVLTAEQFLKTL